MLKIEESESKGSILFEDYWEVQISAVLKTRIAGEALETSAAGSFNSNLLAGGRFAFQGKHGYTTIVL